MPPAAQALVPQEPRRLAAEGPQRLNLGSGTDYRDPEQGWVNMDAYAPKADVRHEMVQFPWPFDDNTFDRVLASHVLEHVPPLFRVDEEGRQRDVFFLLMEELHRVMKPGGVLDVRVPWGGTDVGMCHPQHYRQITPNWFHYFDPACPENYYSTARFKVVEWSSGRSGLRLPWALPIGRSGGGRGPRWPVTSHLAARSRLARYFLTARRELRVTLHAVK